MDNDEPLVFAQMRIHLKVMEKKSVDGFIYYRVGIGSRGVLKVKPSWLHSTDTQCRDGHFIFNKLMVLLTFKGSTRCLLARFTLRASVN